MNKSENGMVVSKKPFILKESNWLKTLAIIKNKKLSKYLSFDQISNNFNKSVHKKPILLRMGFGKSKMIDKRILIPKNKVLFIISNNKLVNLMPFKKNVVIKAIKL